MSSPCSPSVHRPFFRRFRCATVILTVVAGLHSATAEAPEWWITRNVLTADAADDFAVLNQGQLKNLVRGAIDELNAKLSGTGDGAGPQLNALLAGWRANPADNNLAANVGQLKQMGTLVRERLAVMGVPVPPLGTPATADDDDFAPANLGQAKAVFAFEIGNYLDSLGGASADYDQDGLTNGQEFAIGTSPARKDTDGDGMPDPWEVLHTLNPVSPADAGPATGLVVRPEAPVLPDSASFYFDDGNGNFIFDEPGYQAAMDAYYAASTVHAAALAAALVIDPDADQLSNLREFIANTNPRAADSDGDGFNDRQELDFGGNPNDNGAIPPVILSVVSGGGQTIEQGDKGTAHIVVKAMQGGVPKAGVPVTATAQGGLLLAVAPEQTVATGNTFSDGTFRVFPAVAYQAPPGVAALEVTAPGAQPLSVPTTVAALPADTDWSSPASSNLKFMVYARHRWDSRVLDGFQQFEQASGYSQNPRYYNKRKLTVQGHVTAGFGFSYYTESNAFQDTEVTVLTANGGTGVSGSFQGPNPTMPDGSRAYSYAGFHSQQSLHIDSGKMLNFTDYYSSPGPYQTSGTGTSIGTYRANSNATVTPFTWSTSGSYPHLTYMMWDLFEWWYGTVSWGPYFANDTWTFSVEPFSESRRVSRWVMSNPSASTLCHPFSGNSIQSGSASSTHTYTVELEDELDVAGLGRTLQGILASKPWAEGFLPYPPEVGLPDSTFTSYHNPLIWPGDMGDAGEGLSWENRIRGGGFVESVGHVAGDSFEYYIKLETADTSRPVNPNAGPFPIAWNEVYAPVNENNGQQQVVASRQASLRLGESSPHHILAACDYGTTYSGRAWLELNPTDVEVVELSPKLRDDNDDEIPGSELPASGGRATEMVERDPGANPALNNASAVRIAWRDMKVRIGTAMAGRTVTWAMSPEFVPSRADGTPEAGPRFRGSWDTAVSATHRSRFSASDKYGVHDFASVQSTTARTTVDSGGYTAIRVNLPPIGFNKARISLQIQGFAETFNVISLEVPAVIVIDPGHGGIEPATAQEKLAAGYTYSASSGWTLGGSSVNNATALPSQTLEKTMTLDFGRLLRGRLEQLRIAQNLALRIKMTRDADENSRLDTRAHFARDYGADQLLSIHFNDFDDHSARGTEAHVDHTGNLNHAADMELARRVSKAVYDVLHAFDNTSINRGPKSDRGLDVLSDPELGNEANYLPCRATLLEGEFIDVPAVDQLLNTGANHQQVRQAAMNALGDTLLEEIRFQAP